jgi:hypothetical protein
MAKLKSKDASCDLPKRTTSDAVDSTADAGDESRERVPKTIITPVTKRIGESKDNLQRRGDWYQRRSGS